MATIAAGAAAIVAAIALLTWAGDATAEARRPNLRIATDDGSSSLRLRLTTQIRWALDVEGLGTGAVESENVVRFRRLRLALDGSFISEAFTYALQLNLVPGSLELIDFFIDYRFHDEARLRLGQFKIPFTRYRLGSFSTRPMCEWSTETAHFGAERQIGVMIHDDVDSPGGFEYQVGVYTGVNARASNAIGIPLTYDLPRPNPSNLANPAAPSSFHPELAAHVAYNHGGIDVRAPQDFGGGPPRFAVGASVAWDARPTPGQDMALRLAPELVVKMWGLTLWGVFYAAFFDEIEGSETTRLGFLGGVAQASYAFLDHFEVGLRYTNVTITRALREDARAHADARIAAEADEARDALAARLAPVGTLEAIHDVTLGFNVYVLAAALKLGIDGSLIMEERTDGTTDYGLLVQLQTQLAF